MTKLTVKQFSEKINQDLITANALIKFLTAKGLATEAGKAPSTGKGRSSTLYNIPEKVELDLSVSDLAKALIN